MISPELMRQFRRLQLKAKRTVQSLLEGRYHSAFRGTGLTFEEVRAYQPGDDVRAIDWNVTARTGSPFVKRYVEERELTVLLVADVSGSLSFGSQLHPKRTVLGEVAALIAFSAVSNQDRVGLIAGGAKVERHVRPERGPTHALRILRDVLTYQPVDPGTSLDSLLDFTNRVYRRRAIVFLFSDFLQEPEGYESVFRLAGRAHDLIAIRVTDPREHTLPDAGLIRFDDGETGEQRLIDTSSQRLRDDFAYRAELRAEQIRKMARSCDADLVDVTTDGGHLEALIRFLQIRARRLRGGN